MEYNHDTSLIYQKCNMRSWTDEKKSVDKKTLFDSRLFKNSDDVTHMKCSFLDNFGEDTLGRHNAFANLLLDGTAFVTFFANLCDFLHSFTNLETSSHRQFIKTDAFCSQILGKLSGGQTFNPHLCHDVDAFLGQKADLAVPVAGVGISDNAVITFADGKVNRGFDHTFFFGYVDRCNSSFDHMLITSFKYSENSAKLG